ncbi:hypothetical protein [Oceanobacillus halotolerans]|uniref:hypothetical protein n=1 Tax=Oceanobacillus halotolerans TaxID=2663380 RepID=UPI0013DB21B2|nr:hypothetical protein [Oceanobacillus halotolerans]
MKKTSKWTLTSGGITVLVGTTLEQSIQGKLSGPGLLGSLIITILLFVINIIRIRSKKDKTPEFDERTTRNMVKFLRLFIKYLCRPFIYFV